MEDEIQHKLDKTKKRVEDLIDEVERIWGDDKMKKYILVLLLIFLVSCISNQSIIIKDKNNHCFLFPNDNSKCNCLEYEVRKEINYSILEKSCISINLNQKNETTMKIKIITESNLIDEELMRKQFESQTKNMSLRDIFLSEIKLDVQRPLRNINFSFMENGLMCFDFGGEYKSIQVDNQVIEHSANLSNLYYYVETDNCINATSK